MDSYFEDKPPQHSLEIIKNQCYGALSLYLYLWKNRNYRNVVTLDVQDVVLISSQESFKENLRDLQIEHLISYMKMKDQYIIKVLE